MYVREVKDLFLHYIDERDQTFLDPTVVAVYLKLGYSDFRQTTAHQDATFYETIVSFLVNNQDFYDFADPASAVRLLGNPAGGLTGPRLQRIVEIVQPAANVYITPLPWTGVQSMAQLSAYDRTYLWSGTRLYFGGIVNDTTLKMRYVGNDSVDWTKQAAGDNERIDDSEEWHDLIALLAAQQYAIKDGAFNAQLQKRLETRLQAYKEFVAIGRDTSASTRVQMTYSPGED